MSDENEDSSSYEEVTDSSSERAWTCDDIYPAEPGKPKPESSEDSSSEEEEPSSTEEESCTDNVRKPLSRHSSGEVEAVLKSQEKALKDVTSEEQKRRLMVSEARNLSKEKNDRVLDVSSHLDKEFKDLSREYDSSDETMRAIETKLAHKKNTEPKKEQSLEKARFDKRNIEREMRLAKARERIEKKKEEQETKEAEEKLKQLPQKLDMSKSARVERAYSWYTRMAMPNREKMKERVQFMPASAGVTPDDVDLLPWNARGTFVSVAAMMRMNRTGFLNDAAGGGNDDSDSD